MIEHEYVIVKKDELYHYGVKGMKWRQHLKNKISSTIKSAKDLEKMRDFAKSGVYIKNKDAAKTAKLYKRNKSVKRAAIRSRDGVKRAEDLVLIRKEKKRNNIQRKLRMKTYQLRKGAGYVLSHNDETGNELYHYGVKGMRRGVRRFTNPDGTLNAAGRMRYEIGKYGRLSPVVRSARAATVATASAKRKLNNYRIKQRDRRMEKKTGSSEAVRKERSRLIQLERESRIRESKRNASSTAKTLANKTKLGTAEKLARNSEVQRYKNIDKAEGKTSGSSTSARRNIANAVKNKAVSDAKRGAGSRVSARMEDAKTITRQNRTATVIGKGQQIANGVKGPKTTWSTKHKEMLKQTKKKARGAAAKKKMERRNKLHTAMRAAEKRANMSKSVRGGIGARNTTAKKVNSYRALSKRLKKIAK